MSSQIGPSTYADVLREAEEKRAVQEIQYRQRRKERLAELREIAAVLSVERERYQVFDWDAHVDWLRDNVNQMTNMALCDGLARRSGREVKPDTLSAFLRRAGIERDPRVISAQRGRRVGGVV